MTDMRNLARVAMASKVLADVAREEGNAARELLAEAMLSSGAERVRVTDGNAVDYGAVVLVPGRKSAVVVDEAALLGWVAARYPDEVVQQVRRAWLERLLSAAAKLGDPVDPATGEVIPGVEVRQGDPYLAAKPSAEARDRMKTTMANQGLLMLGLAEAGEPA
ncbi:hypothetical protein Drose_06510 [Dactylosporangium roseum]|uniref:Uncharacterized protein n=1 Tax=Dactylosporangium roseum TaxID=47989 RepID=A0ABY5Z789_9ACTN|nr:hypothetical protein [Dactylosporangium roseum]UWZ37925.1 hypothetical protein Drose_06510 [Dactylosporangium roseum]